MRNSLHPTPHQDYLDAIQKHCNCDLRKAVILAICVAYQNKGCDIKHNSALRDALLKNGIDGNLWLLDELFEKSPNLFPPFK